MTPADILSRKPNGLVCSDCDSPATVVDLSLEAMTAEAVRLTNF